MEYRLSLTPRLLAVALCASVALMVLLFALGFQIGRSSAGAAAANAIGDGLAGRVTDGVGTHTPAGVAPHLPPPAGDNETAVAPPRAPRAGETP